MRLSPTKFLLPLLVAFGKLIAFSIGAKSNRSHGVPIKIGEGHLYESGLFDRCEPHVAAMAKQAANGPGGVVMVNERPSQRCLAHPAQAPLLFEHGAKVLWAHAVLIQSALQQSMRTHSWVQFSMAAAFVAMRSIAIKLISGPAEACNWLRLFAIGAPFVWDDRFREQPNLGRAQPDGLITAYRAVTSYAELVPRIWTKFRERLVRFAARADLHVGPFYQSSLCA